MSPELIFVDVSLGRSEGIDLIPSLRNVVGIEEIPVILVDEKRNTSRRGAAQRAGAIGYLTDPIDVSRIASQIEKTITQPKRRRFTRYAQQSAVYRVRESGHRGIGLRFQSISEQHEAALIDYLHRLH